MDPSAAYKDPKQEKDLRELAERAIQSAETYAAAGDMENTTNVILAAEKECRLAADGASAARVCVWLLKTLFEKSMLKEGCEWILMASKKRSQLKRVQKEMVHEGMVWIEKPWPSRSDVYELVETLCKVTDGKIFLELERARIILKLSHMKEEEGDIDTAAEVLQEVQVESNIYMDKIEKGLYILEQMRLVIQKHDWIRCHIISKKINRRVIEGEGFEFIKLCYYSYMLQYYNHQMLNEEAPSGVQLAECFGTCLETDFESLSDENFLKLKQFLPSTVVQKSDLKAWYLSALIVCLAISEESPEKVDSLRRVLAKHEKALRERKDLRECAEQLIDRDVSKFTGATSLFAHPLLADDSVLPGSQKRRELLRLAYLRHNLVVVSLFYKRSTLEKLGSLMDFTLEETEEQLCHLILNRNIKAKINRPTGEVIFNERKEEVAMQDWSHSICQTLDALCEACNLIEKERYITMATS